MSVGVRHHSAVEERPELRRTRSRYRVTCRIARMLRRRGTLPNDALLVVLEWGPPMRLPEAWRLQQRHPRETVSAREAALAEAHAVRRAANDLTAAAWPHDRREEASEVDRVGAVALQDLVRRYPHLDRASLRRAVDHANYTHAK